MLTIKINAGLPDNFIKNYLPQFIKKYLMGRAKDNIYKKVFEYINKNYKIKAKGIFESFIKSLEFINKNEYVIITINNNIRCGDEKLIALINLIDYGNLEIKGTGLFKDTFNFINKNLWTLYLIYCSRKRGNR